MKTSRVLASIVGLAVVASTVVALVGFLPSREPTELKSQSRGRAGRTVAEATHRSPSVAAHRLKAGRTARLRKWLKQQQKFSTVASASAALSFELRMPDSSLATNAPGPASIYVTADSHVANRRAYVPFGIPEVDIQMWAEPTPEKPDYSALAATFRRDKEEGHFRANPVPFVLSVRGMDGIGTEPGFNDLGDTRTDRPGVVQWWEDGVQYTIHGTWGTGGTSVRELLVIAESMYE